MPLRFGEPAPWFRAATPSHPEFTFDSVAGRYVLLAFLPGEPAARAEALKAVAAFHALLDDSRLSAFVLVRDAQTAAGVRDMRGLRWVLDLDGAVSRQFGALGDDGVEHPHWLLLDPALRAIEAFPIDQPAAVFDALYALPAPADHAGVETPAPVLIAPRIFEPDFCRELMALIESGEGRFSGVMRDRADRTVHVMDELKVRRDVLIEDPALQAEVRARLEARLFPFIERAFGFRVTRVERYLVSCYAADDGGVFHAHRDNTTMGTAHRAFAGSINLNDDFEGGDLRFPEFGRQTYRPPVGGACVFACGLLHEATRVTVGRRFAFLPFFYDEAGAAVRAAYQTRVANKA